MLSDKKTLTNPSLGENIKTRWSETRTGAGAELECSERTSKWEVTTVGLGKRKVYALLGEGFARDARKERGWGSFLEKEKRCSSLFTFWAVCRTCSERPSVGCGVGGNANLGLRGRVWERGRHHQQAEIRSHHWG